MAAARGGRDRKLGVPVHSLYGNGAGSLRPAGTALRGLDALVFDIQDVGARYYTYQATMLFCMEAAAHAKLGFFVLDRPNPIGGRHVEGPALRPGFGSFCGVHDVAVRHGLTVGELAALYRRERKLDLALTVIPCRGWRREMFQRDTRLPWVFPSPNMPTPETALVYPGMCLLEGTNLSEGRGTTRPFELFGAPWLDADSLIGSARGRTSAGGPVPTGPLRPDVGQTRREALPRRRGLRRRPRGVSSLPHRRRVHRRGARAGSGTVPVADGSVRIRRGDPGVRPAVRIVPGAGGDRTGPGVARPRGGLGARGAGVPPAKGAPPPVRTVIPSDASATFSPETVPGGREPGRPDDRWIDRAPRGCLVGPLRGAGEPVEGVDSRRRGGAPKAGPAVGGDLLRAVPRHCGFRGVLGAQPLAVRGLERLSVHRVPRGNAGGADDHVVAVRRPEGSGGAHPHRGDSTSARSSRQARTLRPQSPR